MLNIAVKCVITSISTFPHRAHNITPFDAVGLMLLETSAKVFLPWGKKYFRIYFATTATKYDMRYYSNKYKGVAFCHDLNETELKLCHCHCAKMNINIIY